jgi:putative ABC transport system permease protein
MQFYLRPAILGGVIASFLIIMVALGLSGVLWQTVTRRTSEIGLRRALGATGGQVNVQILIEVALLSTLAVVIGVVVAVQLPLLGVFRLVSGSAFTIGLVASLATIYGLTLLCGLYPSWLAGRVQPAQALHYE